MIKNLLSLIKEYHETSAHSHIPLGDTKALARRIIESHALHIVTADAFILGNVYNDFSITADHKMLYIEFLYIRRKARGGEILDYLLNQVDNFIAEYNADNKNSIKRVEIGFAHGTADYNARAAKVFCEKYGFNVTQISVGKYI